MIRSLLRLRFCFSNEEEEGREEGALLCEGTIANSVSIPVVLQQRVVVAVPNYKTVSRRNCPLLKFLWDRDWPRVIHRVESHPHESYCLIEHSKRSALHLASFNHGCPLLVAEALLLANVHALYMEDSLNLTPLHYACSFKTGTDHLVPLFCRTLEELDKTGFARQIPELRCSSSCSSGRRSPLLMACHRNAPISVLCALVMASCSRGGLSNKWIAPVTGAEPHWHAVQNFGMRALSPLAALVDQYLDLEQAMHVDFSKLREQMELSSCSSEPFQDFELEENKDAFSVLRKVIFLIQHTLDDDYNGSALHIACSLKVSIPSLAEIFGAALPEQATIRDSLGCIPLHHVLMNPHSPLQLVRNVLAMNPEEACTIPTRDGAFPLLLAIRQGWDWENCISVLVKASPATLDIYDTTTGLVPFLLAASVDADVTTIFELLRASPYHLVSCSS